MFPIAESGRCPDGAGRRRRAQHDRLPFL